MGARRPPDQRIRWTQAAAPATAPLVVADREDVDNLVEHGALLQNWK